MSVEIVQRRNVWRVVVDGTTRPERFPTKYDAQCFVVLVGLRDLIHECREAFTTTT